MGSVKIHAIAVWLAVLTWAVPETRAAGPVTLREAPKTDTAVRVTVGLKAKGQYIPATPPGQSKEQAPKPLALQVESEQEFVERVLATDAQGRAGRAVRRVLKAASAVNGEIRPTASAVRPEVALLVVELKNDAPVVYSPLGPLTRAELEVLQAPGDPLTLQALLPKGPVEVGATWKVGDAAARALSDYDSVSTNSLEGTLESADAETARVRLRGQIRGSVLGGEGTVACEGSFVFDRKAGRISRLGLNRAETRRPGPVEGGLDIKSTLTVTREAAEIPGELTDATLEKVVLNPGPERELLTFTSPGGKFSLRHDRDWHVYWDDPRLTVLRRVVNGEMVAQCNLASGPNAGKGKHQDPAQFRDDIKKGLGPRFVQFLGTGEVEGPDDGSYRYKVGVEGQQGGFAVVWYYYLLASPAGDQLVGTFTLARDQIKPFGDRDETLVKALRWANP